MMKEAWDAIIIGAGIGGLTAAAHLVKAGLRVLVLERNPHPGGTTYAYHRKGFTFPMGPLGFSQPELIQETLNELGIGEDFKLVRISYRLRAFDLDIPLSLPFPEIINDLSRLFHSDTQGIMEFFKFVEEATSSNPLSFKEISNISASEYLHRLIKDWRLRRILGSIGTREPYSGLSLLASMWDLMCRKGIWYPREGMKSFCGRLLKAVTNFPGMSETRLGTEVIKIRVEKGKVQGVTLRDGTEIKSTSIISNADYKNTFIKLLDPEEVPPDWHHAVSRARQTNSIFQVCLGVDKKKVDLSVFKEATRLIYRKKGDIIREEIDWGAVEIDQGLLAQQELEVSLWGKETMTLSPKGGAVIVIRTEADYSHFARYRSDLRRRSPEYQEYKTKLAYALIHEIEHLIPGIGNSILVMDVATPLTFEDQGGRSQGAVAGWSWDYEDFRDGQARELIRTPIKGLYMAGYQAFSALFMGGIPTAMESGKRAARALLSGVGPIKAILIPGVK